MDDRARAASPCLLDNGFASNDNDKDKDNDTGKDKGAASPCLLANQFASKRKNANAMQILNLVKVDFSLDIIITKRI